MPKEILPHLSAELRIVPHLSITVPVGSDAILCAFRAGSLVKQIIYTKN